MPRSKNYSTTRPVVPVNSLSDEPFNPVIELPHNPKNHRKLDLSLYLGRGYDAWVKAFASVLRSLLASGNFTVSSIASLHSNGIKHFLPFLIDGPLHFPPKTPDKLTAFDLNRYVARLKVQYPNGSTAKNCFMALKTVLTGLADYGFIHIGLNDLLPVSPFPQSEIILVGEKPLSAAEMSRLSSATKLDLIAIHQDRFDGPDSEAMAVLILIIAMRTGINATPLMELGRDCLTPHPFMPSLMLLHSIKRRGQGAQSQSIRQTALHDKLSTIRMDGVAVLRKALELSESLVDLAQEEFKNRIWLYRHGQPGRSQNVSCLNGSMTAASFRNFVKRHRLIGDDGAPMRVTLGSLRKTMENRLWKLSDGDLITVAAIMGHSPQVADNHYLKLDEETKAEGARFIGTVFTEALRGENLAPTPSGNCQDSLHGSLAPKDGKSHCEQFTHCLGCPSYAIVGTHADLYRLFSFQVFLSREIDYFHAGEWAEWRDHHGRLIDLINSFTHDKFAIKLIEGAKAAALENPHPFWAAKIRQLNSSMGEAT
jgi:integrase